MLSYVLHLALQKCLSLLKYTLVFCFISISNARECSKVFVATRLLFNGMWTFVSAVGETIAMLYIFFKFYFCEKYFYWNSVCSQGSSVYLKSRMHSKPVVLTFKCMLPPGLTKSPRLISIHFRNVCRNFVD